MKDKNKRLIEFADVTLDILEKHEDWNSETTDTIAGNAIRLKLATVSTKAAMFRRTSIKAKSRDIAEDERSTLAHAYAVLENPKEKEGNRLLALAFIDLRINGLDPEGYHLNTLRKYDRTQ